MNLIRHTFLRTGLLILPFILLGGIITYFTFRYIAYDEIDEFLIYEMNRITSYHALNNDVPDKNSIVRIYPAEVDFTPFFADTLLLETGDMEMVPYRELHFTLRHEDNLTGVVVQQLMMGSDDIIGGALWLMTSFTLLLVILFVPGVLWVTRSLWKPFYQTLTTIQQYRPDQVPSALPAVPVSEFDQLNRTLNDMLQKISSDYTRTKSFNENAAHELQTQLALIKSANESLIDHMKKKGTALIAAQKTQVAATRLSQMLRSMLLLSKIGNREFTIRKSVDLAQLTDQILLQFSDLTNARNLTIRADLMPVTQQMDPGLAEVLLTNLIKNALTYSTRDSLIQLELRKNSFTIENVGKPLPEDPSEMLKRFKKGTDGNMGLGLSIVHEICNLYGFSLSYAVEQQTHRICITFSRFVGPL